jgi:hypothetical protein
MCADELIKGRKAFEKDKAGSCKRSMAQFTGASEAAARVIKPVMLGRS